MLKKEKEEYKKKYQVELEKDIIGDTSGDFKRLLVSLLTCTRSENDNPDIEKCKKIAKELYNAGEEKLGTNEEIFNKYFGTSSPAELMFIAREYHRENGNTLMTTIKSEFSGDICKLIKTVFYANISSSEYFSTRIRDTLKDLGTNIKILNRVVITRNEIDMKIIKEYNKLLYQKNKVEDIKNDTSGDYRKLLVAIIDK